MVFNLLAGFKTRVKVGPGGTQSPLSRSHDLVAASRRIAASLRRWSCPQLRRASSEAALLFKLNCISPFAADRPDANASEGLCQSCCSATVELKLPDRFLSRDISLLPLRELRGRVQCRSAGSTVVGVSTRSYFVESLTD